jgi:hypothetical protein
LPLFECWGKNRSLQNAETRDGGRKPPLRNTRRSSPDPEGVALPFTADRKTAGTPRGFDPFRVGRGWCCVFRGRCPRLLNITRVQNSFRAWRLGQEKTLSPRRWGSPKPFERGQNRGLRCILKVFESSKPTCAVLDSIVTFTETWFWTRQRDIHGKRLNPSKTSFQRCFGQQCRSIARSVR